MAFDGAAFDPGAFDVVSVPSLIVSQSPDFVVLAEVQIMEPLAVWTAAGGGLTSTWYAAYSTQIATTIIGGGIYRRLDLVRQNATALISRASAALVDANLGSYFHDTANSRIYVSTAAGTHPDLAALIGVWFTLFFSTRSVSFTDAQPVYAPLITGTLPTLKSEMPDPLFGSITSDTGELGLLNGDGLFDRLSRQYTWRNKKVTFKLGGASGTAYSAFVTVATMLINSLQVTDEVATLQLEQIGTLLNQSIPPRTFGDGFSHDDAGEGVLGLSQPWVFGVPLDCPLPLIDKTVLEGEYQFIDLLLTDAVCVVNTVYAIDRASGVRTTLPQADYLDNTFSVIVTNAAYNWATHDILADITAYTTPTFATIVTSILTEMGVPVDYINMTAVHDEAPQHLGVYLKEAQPAADVVRTLEQSVRGQIYIAADGGWRGRVPSISAPADFTLTDEDFMSWEADSDLQAVLNEVRVQYDYRHHSGSASETSSSSDAVRYGSETTDTHRVFTHLRNLSDATPLAGHLRFFAERPSARIRFEERGLILMEAQAGDVVAVTRDRAPNARTGRYDGHLLRLIQVEKSLGPETPTVRGVLEDMGGQTDRIARCMGAAEDVNWSAATDAQRGVYGFCCDTSGYIDSTDALTRELKVAY